MTSASSGTSFPKEQAVVAEQSTINESGIHDDAQGLQSGRFPNRLPDPYPQKYKVHDHCVVCNKPLIKRQLRYCSVKCSLELYKYDWAFVRPRVLKRDNYSCIKCGAKAQIEVHHVKPIALGGTNRDDNLITLCFDCHRESHRREAKVPSPKVLKAVRSNSKLTKWGAFG